MAATGKPNHWDELAEELGAEAPPQQSAPRSEPPRPAAAARKTPSTQPKSKPPSTNWGELASSLGVPGGSEYPARSPEAGDVSRTDADDELESAGDEIDRDEDQDDDGDEDLFGYDFEPDMSFECDLFAGGLSLETASEPAPGKEEAAQFAMPIGDAPPPADSDEDTEVDDEIADEPVASEAEDAAPAGASSPEDETVVRKSRRRRRGRRGKRSGREAKDSKAETSTGDEEDGTDSDLETIEDVLVEPSGEGDESNRDAESAAKRPKRKRRRRGGSKGAAKKAADEDESGDTFDDPTDDDDDDDDERSGAKSDKEDDEDEEDSKGGGDRGKHRAIPSWGEAIGVIIEANLASRAKNPSSSAASSRGRGRRGRGRSSGK